MKTKDPDVVKVVQSTGGAKIIPVRMRRSPRATTQESTCSSALAAARKKGYASKKPKRSQDIMRDMYFNAQQSKDLIMKPTGIIYDDSMTQHVCLWDSSYPECPERYSRVLERCRELGLVERCSFIQPREATREEILKKHTPEQIDILAKTEGNNNLDELETLSSHYDAIYIHPTSYRLSLLAAGSTIELVDNICKGNIKNGMAIIRPPGHHAMKSEYCGYCFFNNVAAAAEHALDSAAASRVLIVDWDVHHGQATQQMFYEDNRVVYFSIHRYEHGTFWPNLRESEYDYIGQGVGQGYNFNIPLNQTRMKDADYLAVFHQVLLPLTAEFEPDLIIVSAGYDAAIGCLEGEMEITPACYAHLLHSLTGFAQGKVAVILEGGYCLKSLSEGAALTLRALLDDPCPNIEPLGAPSQSITETILNCIYEHRPYWNCFKFQDTYSQDLKPPVPLHRPRAVFRYEGNPKQEVYATRDCYPVQSTDFIKLCDERLDNLRASTRLLTPPHKVSLIYHELMLKHVNIKESDHPEQPSRIFNIFEKHKEFGLLDRVHLLKPRVATDEEISLVHTDKHIQNIRSLDELTPRELLKKQTEYESVYLHPSTRESAYLAAGCLLEVVDSVLNGESAHGVAIIRPPGHHAESDNPCGFCIFNNVSVAAKYAVESHGLSRVLILDWDVHHGNGTQAMFYNDPRILYISVHRYDHGAFFPHSKDAGPHNVGEGKGEGFNVNVGWNKKGMSDAEYTATFQQVILPIAYQYNPELVLVSAGFDACVNDPLGGCKVSPEAYGHFTHWLKALAQGRIILALEGGYNISSISYAMTLCTKALLGDPLPPLESDLIINSSAVTSIKETIKSVSPYWSCLKFLVALPENLLLTEDSTILNLALSKLTLTESEPQSISTNELHTPRQSAGYPLDAEQTPGSDSSINQSASCSQVDDGKQSADSIGNLSVSCLRDGDEKQSADSINNESASCLRDDDRDNNNPDSSTNESMLCLRNINEKNNADSSRKDSVAVPRGDEGKNSIDLNQSVSCLQNSDGKDSDSDKRPPVMDFPGPSSSSQSSGDKNQTLSDYLAENAKALVNEEMFLVTPLSDCPHTVQVNPVPESGIDVNSSCLDCSSTVENWICLICYQVRCGRYIEEHSMIHGVSTDHPLALSFADLSVWCYVCQAYVDNHKLYEAKNAAHRSKFGDNLVWSYGPRLY